MKYLETLVDRLRWDDTAMRYPKSVRMDCIRNAFLELLAEIEEKEALKQQKIDESYNKENPYY